MHILKFVNLPPHHWYGTELPRARVCLQPPASHEGRGESSFKTVGMSISQYYEPLAGINVVNYLAKKNPHVMDDQQTIRTPQNCFPFTE